MSKRLSTSIDNNNKKEYIKRYNFHPNHIYTLEYNLSSATEIETDLDSDEVPDSQENIQNGKLVCS